jgi:ComF family protein
MGCGILFNPPAAGNPSLNGPVTGGAYADKTVSSVTGNGFDDESQRNVSPTAVLNMAQWVCPRCIAGWVPVMSPLCSVCGTPFNSREGDDHVCGECLQVPKNLRMARAAAIYTPLTLTLLHGFKYNSKIQLAGPFGAMLADAFVRFWDVGDVDLVLPVPLHRRRFRRRGFNQAYLLAKALIRQLNRIESESTITTVERGALLRTRRTASQTGLKRKGRLQNIKDAFRVKKTAAIKDRRILLIDDIYTTGATVNECAKVLLGSGALRVDVLTVARAV